VTRKQKILLFLGVIIVLTVAGRLFLNAPIAKIRLAPETVVSDVFGRWDLTNSMIAAWIAMGIVLLVAYLGTRRMALVPRGVQNFVEWIIEFLLGIAEGVAGKVNGRRFFPLVATIFLFIVVANWIALTPVFGNIGKIESAEMVLTHGLEKAAVEAKERATAEQKAILGEYKEELRAYRKSGHHEEPPPEPPPLVRALVVGEALGEEGDEKLHIFDRQKSPILLPIGFKKVKELELAEWWNFTEWKRWQDSTRRCPHNDEQVAGPVVCSDEETVNLDGKTVGILIPYLRSANTDLMVTFGMALVAMTLVHYWGIKANGFGGYGSRFANVRQGPVLAFVGALESIGELARVLSLSFRLLGNTFAGEVLIFVLAFLLPAMLAFSFAVYGFELFVGLIQAVVFMGLVLVFATLAVTSHNGHRQDEGGEGGASHR